MKANFFDQGSPYLHHPLLTPERTAKEIDFILSIIDIKPGGKVLDIGCGAGRHSIELARRGYTVLGIDPSEAMVTSARERSAGENLKPEFRQMRGEELQLEHEFEAAICLFTTLGQIADQEDNRKLLDNAARCLHPGGFFVIDIPQREWLVSNIKLSENFDEGEIHTEVERSYDQKLKIITEIFSQESRECQRTFLLRYRLFNRRELTVLLENAGFIDLKFFGEYGRKPLTIDCPTVVVSARTRAQ